VQAPSAYLTQHSYNTAANKMSRLSSSKLKTDSANKTLEILAAEGTPSLSDTAPRTVNASIDRKVKRATDDTKRKLQSSTDVLLAEINALKKANEVESAKRRKLEATVNEMKQASKSTDEGNDERGPATGANQNNPSGKKSRRSKKKKSDAAPPSQTPKSNLRRRRGKKQAKRSRRCQQRFKRRLAKAESAALSSAIGLEEELDVDKAKSRAAIDDHLIRQRFGFVPDISTTPFNNAVRLRESSMSSSLVSTMPSNMAFHDLTPSHRVPKAAKSLLGLGSKFIVTPSKTTGSIEQTIKRFQRDFHLKVYFACECDETTELARAADFSSQQRSKLYVKSKWNPTENDVPFWVTARLSKFFARVQRLFRQRRATSNLLPYQEEMMNSLLEDPTLLFPDTDKGLGPCAVEYGQYVEDCLVHLRNDECYQQLSMEEAETEVSLLTEKIESWLKKYKQVLGKHAVGYIENHIKANSSSPFGQFYILYKIHKGMAAGQPALSAQMLLVSPMALASGSTRS
jgi:hypothetical protein